MPGVYLCLVVKVTAGVLAYPSNAILLTNSAPSMLVLGAINGVSASTASLSRAFGPTISGLIHSAGLKMGYSGLAWWAGALVCVFGAIESLWMEEVEGRFDRRSGSKDVAPANEDCFDSIVVGAAAVVEAGHAGNASDRAQLDQYSIAKDCHLAPRMEVTPSPSYEPYVYYLETRVSYLESVLQSNNVAFAAPEILDLSSRPGPDPNASHTPTEEHQLAINNSQNANDVGNGCPPGSRGQGKRQKEAEKLNKLVSNIGMVSVQGTSDPRYLGSTSGISFARVVFAAVKSSVSGSSSERAGIRPSKPISAGVASSAGSTSMRDSFFGLHTKPMIKQAPFPNKELGFRLARLYFEHANPQIPILHRGEFMSLCERVYSSDERLRTPRELYMLNIVFAIGAGIFLGGTDSDDASPDSHKNPPMLPRSPPSPTTKRIRLSSQQYQPEEYHASAIVHLESFLGSSPAADRPDGFGGGLEELQAVLLLAGFALLRPVAPGLWYIVGVAVRLGVDLGLHHEDGTGVDAGSGDEDIAMGSTDSSGQAKFIDPKEKGRREWVRDLRRRLWWCVYSFDRLVSTCVGRPFGISDDVITTEFPSLLDDAFITTAGFSSPPEGPLTPSYKLVAHHYIRLRLLQSEILQVLQHQQAQQVRLTGDFEDNPYLHTQLQSPFLRRFESFRAWRVDIDQRLREWKDSAPKYEEIGVQFSTEFLQLNYWQAIIMLYRQSLTVPPVLAGGYNTSDEVSSPSIVKVEDREDEEQVFLKVAEAGQKVLRIYRQLHRVHLVNYTFLATHHLFMAGISFLYAIWHSPTVRHRITLDDMDFTVLAATSVLNDLIDKCPPAEACRDAFERMSRATVQMCLATTGFSSQASGLSSEAVAPQRAYRPTESNASDQEVESIFSPDAPSWSGSIQDGFVANPITQRSQGSRRPPPKFDMNFGDLFSEEVDGNARSSRQNYRSRPTTGSAKIEQQHPPPGGLDQRDLSLEVSNIDPNLQTHEHQQRAEQQAQEGFVTPTQSSYSINRGNANTNTFPEFFDDADFALDNGTGNPGIDLGFGLTFDVDHDFSDGSQFDLFDGFFFGPSGAGL
ncbi:MAG: Fungal specific transcription factor [Geoglossum umbratile]|nr:MAG: Fungal specific transcription factor [Geoglossum umbratile]